jgi:hypothetical protein
MVGAVEGELAQDRELSLDPVEPGAVGRGVGDLDIVRGSPSADPLAPVGGQVGEKLSQTIAMRVWGG